MGHCVKVDGQEYCPHESISVKDVDEEELAQQRCSVFDDVIICQHDLRATFQGGQCLLAGQSYVCEDDIPRILDEKCIEINYEGLLDKHLLQASICDRELINFLNGEPFTAPASE